MNKLLIAVALVFSANTAANACAMYRPQKKTLAVAKIFEKAERAEKRGAVHSAVRYYERVMNASSANAVKRAEAAFRAGRLLQADGKPAKAIKRLRKAVRLHPKHLDAQLALGLSADPKAPAHLKRALSIAGRSGKARASLAQKLAEAGQVDLAQAQLDLARENGAPVKAVIAAEQAIEASRTTSALLQL